MPHLLRDQDGRIMGVFDRPSGGPTEEVAADDPEFLTFMNSDAATAVAEPLRAFYRADLEFIRVLEDLLGALMERNVISLSDLPADAQRKVLGRTALRQMLNEHMPLIGAGDDSERIF